MKKIAIDEKFEKPFLVLVLLFAIFAFFSYWFNVLKYATNAPFWDDYDAILNFLNQFILSNSIHQKISLLLSQHNEHRIVFDRIIALLNVLVTGKIDFIFLIIIGDFGLILLIISLVYFGHKQGISFVYLVPIIIFMLSFSQYELMTFPMACLQQYYQILFSLISIYFFTRDNYYKSLVLGIVFATIASFTGGGGLIIFPVILIFFILQKQPRKAIILTLFTILIFYVYFILLKYQQSTLDILSREQVFANPLDYIKYILAFAGNVIPRLNVAMLLGLIFSIFTLVVFIEWLQNRKFSLLIFIMVFVFATAAAAGLNRLELGVTEALSSRYSIYSLTMLCTVYIYSLKNYSSKSFYIFFSGSLLSIFIFIMWFNPGINNLAIRKSLLQNNLVYPNLSRANEILLKSCKLGIFDSLIEKKILLYQHLTTKLSSQTQYSLDYLNNYKLPFSNSSKVIAINSNEINLQGWAVDSVDNKTASFVFADINGKLYPLNYGIPRSDVANVLKNPNYEYSGFSGTITADNLKKGLNILKLRIINTHKNGYYETKPLEFDHR